MKKVCYLVCVLLVFASCSTKPHADLIITKATIFQVNDGFDKATTMVIRDGKILDIGGDTLLSYYTSDSVMDVKGTCIYPGFIDAHCHFTGYSMDAYKLKLFGITSFQEMLKQVKVYADAHDYAWIEGTGWDQNLWTGKQFPTKDSLDKLFPDKPVFLLRIDGHAALVNQKALDLAGISAATKVEGGEILQVNGKLTGILVDNAINMMRKIMPVMSAKESIQAFGDTEKECAELGLTGIVECGVKPEVIGWMKEAYKAQKLQLRTTFMLSVDSAGELPLIQEKPYKDDHLHVAGYKIYADGALGSRGACMLESYTDRHQHVGTMLVSASRCNEVARWVANSPYQLCVHAIGDSANRTILNVFSRVLPKPNDRRWRIEHAQVVHPDDFDQFGKYTIIPSVQPTHATSDMGWVESRIGPERTKFAYAYQQLLSQNKWLPLGTDFPVEYLNPLYTFYAAVFRQDKNGQPVEGFQTENALTREQALRGITIWAARSVFEENEKGSLEKGKFADFVLLDTDLMTATPRAIYEAKVIQTFIDGKQVYSNPDYKR